MTTLFRPVLALTLAVAASIGAGALRAEAPAGLPGDLVDLEILPGWQTDSGTWMAGIRLRLAPGWKTYWRSPGAAGIPPLFSWAGSENIAAAAFHWPVPEVFDQSGMQSIGYSDEVVIPIEITPAAPGAAPRLAGSVEIGICHDICVPVTLGFAADLAPGGRREPAIVAALVDRPLTAAEAGLTEATCHLVPDDGGVTITAVLGMPPLGGTEVVVVEAADPAPWVSEADVTRAGDRLTATARIVARDRGPVAVDRSGLRFTVLGNGAAADIRGCTTG